LPAAEIPFEILKVDSYGTFETVKLALEKKARYVLASTSEIYGDPLVHPQTEDYFGNVNSMGPRACYDETKRFAEAVVSSAMRGTGKFEGRRYRPLNAVVVRIFNTYGPRMRPEDGRVVPELVGQALTGRELTVIGDGTQTRSFCYVSDLVEGILRAFDSDLREAVNLGNPAEMSILEFARAVQKFSGSASGITHLPARVEDPRRRKPDISKARARLGWTPQVSLEAGMAKTFDYFREKLGPKNPTRKRP
jgi:dTDP-glucose 4,6-dehydratase